MQLARVRERCFPGLGNNSYRVTSEETTEYNCIAWAAHDNGAWWWPDADGNYYWPPAIKREESLASFIAAYAASGYEPCKNSDHEDGFEKIAIYVDKAGVPTHAARQLSNGKWTSKLGSWEDIEHAAPESLEGDKLAYGRVAQILKRART